MIINTDIPGWMTEFELSTIAKLAKLVQDNSLIIELGTFCGRSAWAWMHNMPSNTRLDLVDVWYADTTVNLEEIFSTMHGTEENRKFLIKLIEENEDGSGPYKAVKHFLPENPNVSFYRCDVDDYLITGMPDLVFIDAEHTYTAVSADINRYIQYSRCLLVGHDFANYSSSVVSAVLDNKRDRDLISFKQTSLWCLVPPKGDWKERLQGLILS